MQPPAAMAGALPPSRGQVEAAMSQLELALWLLLAEGLDDATFQGRFARVLEACVLHLSAQEAEHVYWHADSLLVRAGMPPWSMIQRTGG